MYSYLKNKVIKISDSLIEFFRKNLTQIIIIALVSSMFVVLKSLPYFNLIPNLEYIGFGFVLFMVLVLFRVSIPNRSVILIVLSLFLLAAVLSIAGSTKVNELVGFVIFMLVFLTVIRMVAADRDKLKQP